MNPDVLKKEAEQRKEFRDILIALAKSSEMLQNPNSRYEMYIRLEKLYAPLPTGKKFRHFYSDIFSILTILQKEPSYGNIETLGMNLGYIRIHYQPQNTDENGNIIDISDSLNKLYDHVNLDMARISYSDAGDRNVSGNNAIKTLQSKMATVTNDLSQAQNSIYATEEKIRNQQKEYIAILGIFSSVVLSFTAGIVFSTSVLENIAEVSAYRIIMVSLIIGLVFVNILFGLFYYINKIIYNDEKILPLTLSNAVIVVLMIATFVFWNSGYIEERNEKISTPASTEILTETEQPHLEKE